MHLGGGKGKNSKVYKNGCFCLGVFFFFFFFALGKVGQMEDLCPSRGATGCKDLNIVLYRKLC